MNNLLIALKYIAAFESETNNSNLTHIIAVATEAIKSFKEERMYSPLELAELFHNTYEKLAPAFSYNTRKDTKVFDKESANGKLMIAVCKVILQSLSPLKEATDTVVSSTNCFLTSPIPSQEELIKMYDESQKEEQPISSVENEDLEQIIIDQINLSFNEHTGSNEAIQDAAYFLAKRFEGYKAANNHLEVLEKWLISKGGYDKFDSLYITDILNKIKELKYNH